MSPLPSSCARVGARALIGAVALTIGAERAVGQANLSLPERPPSTPVPSSDTAAIARTASAPPVLIAPARSSLVPVADAEPRILHVAPVVARVEDRDRSGRVLMGVVLGAVAGAVVGRVVAGDGCRRGFSGCDGAASVAVITAGGAVLGAIVGGMIGAFR